MLGKLEENEDELIDHYFPEVETLSEVFKHSSLMVMFKSHFNINNFLDTSDFSAFWRWLYSENSDKVDKPASLQLVQALITAGSYSWSSKLWDYKFWTINGEFTQDKLKSSLALSSGQDDGGRIGNNLSSSTLLASFASVNNFPDYRYATVSCKQMQKLMQRIIYEVHVAIPTIEERMANITLDLAINDNHPIDSSYSYKAIRALQIYQILPGKFVLSVLTKLFTALEQVISTDSAREQSLCVEILNTIWKLIDKIGNEDDMPKLAGHSSLKKFPSNQPMPNLGSTNNLPHIAIDSVPLQTVKQKPKIGGHRHRRSGSGSFSREALEKTGLRNKKSNPNPNYENINMDGNQSLKSNGTSGYATGTKSTAHMFKHKSQSEWNLAGPNGPSHLNVTGAGQGYTERPTLPRGDSLTNIHNISRSTFHHDSKASNMLGDDLTNTLNDSTITSTIGGPLPSIKNVSKPIPSQSMTNQTDNSLIYARLIFMFAALAESDAEHEYYYALKLLKKTLEKLPLSNLKNRHWIGRVYKDELVNNTIDFSSQNTSASSSPSKIVHSNSMSSIPGGYGMQHSQNSHTHSMNSHSHQNPHQISAHATAIRTTSTDQLSYRTNSDVGGQSHNTNHSPAVIYKENLSGIVSPLYKGLTSPNKNIRDLAFDLLNLMLPYCYEQFVCGSLLSEKNSIDEDKIFSEHLLKVDPTPRADSNNHIDSANSELGPAGDYSTINSINSHYSQVRQIARDPQNLSIRKDFLMILDDEKINFYNAFSLMTFSILPTLLVEYSNPEKPLNIMQRARTILKVCDEIRSRPDATDKIRKNLHDVSHNLKSYIETDITEDMASTTVIKLKRRWIGVMVKNLHEAIPNTFPRILVLLVSFFVDTGKDEKSNKYDPGWSHIHSQNSQEDESSEISKYINAVLQILEQLVTHSKVTYTDLKPPREDLYAKNLASGLVDQVVKLNTKAEFSESCQDLLHTLLKECSDMAVISRNMMQEYLAPIGHSQKQTLPGLAIKFEVQSTTLIGMKCIVKEKMNEKEPVSREDSHNNAHLIRNDSRNGSLKRQKSFKGLGIRKAHWKKPGNTQKRVRAKFSNVRQFLFAISRPRLDSNVLSNSGSVTKQGLVQQLSRTNSGPNRGHGQLSQNSGMTERNLTNHSTEANTISLNNNKVENIIHNKYPSTNSITSDESSQSSSLRSDEGSVRLTPTGSTVDRNDSQNKERDQISEMTQQVEHYFDYLQDGSQFLKPDELNDDIDESFGSNSSDEENSMNNSISRTHSVRTSGNSKSHHKTDSESAFQSVIDMTAHIRHSDSDNMSIHTNNKSQETVDSGGSKRERDRETMEYTIPLSKTNKLRTSRTNQRSGTGKKQFTALSEESDHYSSNNSLNEPRVTIHQTHSLSQTSVHATGLTSKKSSSKSYTHTASSAHNTTITSIQDAGFDSTSSTTSDMDKTNHANHQRKTSNKKREKERVKDSTIRSTTNLSDTHTGSGSNINRTSNISTNGESESDINNFILPENRPPGFEDDDTEDQISSEKTPVNVNVTLIEYSQSSGSLIQNTSNSSLRANSEIMQEGRSPYRVKLGKNDPARSKSSRYMQNFLGLGKIAG